MRKDGRGKEMGKGREGKGREIGRRGFDGRGWSDGTVVD